MEEKKEPVSKKKGKGTIVLIVLLILVIVGLVCYICYDKGVLFSSKEETTSSVKKENENNDKKTDTEEENVTFTDSELEKYVKYISPISDGPSELLYNTSEVNSKSLSAADKIMYIGSYVYAKHRTSADYQFDIISEEDVKNAIEEVYGPNSYVKATFNLGCGDYVLNENEKNYYSKTGCGGSTATFASNTVIDYKATKSKLEITTAYALFDAIENKIYKDYNKSIPLDGYTGGNMAEIDSYLINYIKNNKDKLNTIVYTFESSDGRNYYFTGFKNSK